MKNAFAIITVVTRLVFSAAAQGIVKDSIRDDGSMTSCAAQVGSTATVERAASLTVPKRTNSSNLTESVVTNNTMTTNIPMFSRAKGIPGTNGINGRIVLAVPACVPIWYDELKAEHLPKLAADGCKQVVVYAVGGSNVVAADDQFLNGRLANYLDTAETLGITVIVSVMWIVQAGDMNALATYAAKFASYPALAGWYVLDEPPANNQQRINHAVTAYGILKAATPSLPTYMAFMLFGNSGAEMLAIPGQYQAAYDVLMWGLLPIIPG